MYNFHKPYTAKFHLVDSQLGYHHWRHLQLPRLLNCHQMLLKQVGKTSRFQSQVDGVLRWYHLSLYPRAPLQREMEQNYRQLKNEKMHYCSFDSFYFWNCVSNWSWKSDRWVWIAPHPPRILIVLACMDKNFLQFGQKLFMDNPPKNLLFTATPFPPNCHW